MSALNSVCIFCGASPGGDVAYRAAADAMGRAIVGRGLRLVYGGAKVGLMGAVADAALSMLDVDHAGFDMMDRKLLLAVIEKFSGGPVGLDNLAAAIGEERDTIEDVLEPYLIQQGFLQRTPRGRIATPHAYRHLGFATPASAPDLFEKQ